jgi:hypothetical protein
MRATLIRRLKRVETRFATAATPINFTEWHVVLTEYGEHWTREVRGDLGSIRFNPITEIVVNKQRRLKVA